MSFTVGNGGIGDKLNRHLNKAQREHADSLEKLSSGQVFTQFDPKPAERALAEGLEFKLRSLASSKRNINDGVSMLQTAEGALSEINNMITRMREINIAGSSTTLSDRERRYLFIEYEALHDEINRVATTTEFNGLPLLNGESERAPESLILRIGDPAFSEDSDDDINVLKFDDLKSIVVTSEGLGLKSARELLDASDDIEGIALDDVMDLLAADDEAFPTAYDQALNTLSTHRAVFGAMQSRLNRAMDFLDVYQENIAAAKSKIADTDYAKEVARLTESSILMQAGTSLMSQSNLSASLSLNLLTSVLR